MAILGQIRNRIGLVFVVIVIAIAAFLVSDALSSGSAISQMFNNDFSVGEVAGKDINVQYFQDRFSRNIDQQGGAVDDTQRELILNQTWQQMVNEVTFDEELKSVGLEVPESEVTELMLGVNPHPAVQQIQIFYDSTGKYDPEMVKLYMNISQDPNHQYQGEAARVVAEVIEYLYNVRREEKYMNLLKSGLLVSSNEAKYQNEMESRSYNVSFFGVNYSVVTDTTPLSDSEYRAYYNDHKEEFKQDLEVSLNYVRFPKNPSKDDSLKAYDAAKNLMEGFQKAESDSDYVFLHSDFPAYDSLPKTLMEVPAGLQRRISGVTGDTVLGPIIDGKGYRIYKLADVSNSGDGVVKARHLLVRALSEEDKADARTKANELRGRIASEGFTALLGESDDQQTPNGELGWINEKAFGPDFWATVSGASTGSTVVAESPQGIHVVEILDKSSSSFVVNSIFKEMFVGTLTSRELYSKASQFASMAFSMNSVKAAADSTPGVNLGITPSPITPANTSIPGLPGGRNIAAWALRSKPGDISSQIFDLESDYVVAQVDTRKEEGYKALEDIKEQIEPEVRKQVKAKKIIADLKGINATDLNGYKEGYGGGGFVSSATGLSLGGANPPAPLTNEAELIGKIAGLPVNQLSQPMQGESGVYIFQVTQITDPTPLETPEAIAGKVQQIQGTRQFSMENKFRLALRELANVEDTRFKFDF